MPPCRGSGFFLIYRNFVWENEMKRRNKKILAACVLLALAALLILKFFADKGSPDRSARLSFRLNWDVDIPAGEERYVYSKPNISYYVVQYTGREEKKLMKLLKGFRTKEGRKIKEEQFLEDLAVYEADIEQAQLPNFDRIDYFCTAAHGLSKLYLFYDSDSQVLYLCQLLD